MSSASNLFSVATLPQEAVPAKTFVKPGWYQDIPNEDYHRGSGTSSSNLKTLLPKTPAHLQHEKQNPKDATKAMNLGTAVHSLVLEPENFDKDIAVMPVLNLRTKADQAEKAEFLIENKGKTIITPEQLVEAKAMAARVLEHPIAKVLVSDIICESSVYWWYKSMDTDDTDDYKEMLKVRPDGISKKMPILIDLKTTKDASYSGFIRSIQDYNYHISAAMYLEGVNQCQELLDEIGFFAYTKFVFVCVENFPPYEVACYELSDDYLNLGKQLYRRAVFNLKYGRENKWPGYPEEVRIIEPPSYASKIWTV